MVMQACLGDAEMRGDVRIAEAVISSRLRELFGRIQNGRCGARERCSAGSRRICFKWDGRGSLVIYLLVSKLSCGGNPGNGRYRPDRTVNHREGVSHAQSRTKHRAQVVLES